MLLSQLLLGTLVWTVLSFALAPVAGRLLKREPAARPVLVAPCRELGAARSARAGPELGRPRGLTTRGEMCRKRV